MCVSKICEYIHTQTPPPPPTTTTTALTKMPVFTPVYPCYAMLFYSSFFPHGREKDTIKLLSKLQKSTRQMQAVCAHSKLVRDAQLALEVPGIKKVSSVVCDISYRIVAVMIPTMNTQTRPYPPSIHFSTCHIHTTQIVPPISLFPPHTGLGTFDIQNENDGHKKQ